MERIVPGLRAKHLPGCDHWIQRERPAQANEALLKLPRETV